MARMSVSEAARQAGISRQYFYKKYINDGIITVSEDESGNKYIDDSELKRAFSGRLPATKAPSTRQHVNQPVNSQQKLQEATPDNYAIISSLEVRLKAMSEQLADRDNQLKDKADQIHKAEEREHRLLDQIDKLTDSLKQIEHKPSPVTPQKQSFWARLMGR